MPARKWGEALTPQTPPCSRAERVYLSVILASLQTFHS